MELDQGCHHSLVTMILSVCLPGGLCHGRGCRVHTCSCYLLPKFTSFMTRLSSGFKSKAFQYTKTRQSQRLLLDTLPWDWKLTDPFSHFSLTCHTGCLSLSLQPLSLTPLWLLSCPLGPCFATCFLSAHVTTGFSYQKAAPRGSIPCCPPWWAALRAWTLRSPCKSNKEKQKPACFVCVCLHFCFLKA